MAHQVTGQDLRIGVRFTAERAAAVVRALSEAARTIADMPARHTRFPGSDASVFLASPATAPRRVTELTLDGAALEAFGTLTVPGPVWRTLQRLGAWVEPVLIGEWVRYRTVRKSRPTSHSDARFVWFSLCLDERHWWLLTLVARYYPYDNQETVSDHGRMVGSDSLYAEYPFFLKSPYPPPERL